MSGGQAGELVTGPASARRIQVRQVAAGHVIANVFRSEAFGIEQSAMASSVRFHAL